MLKNVFLVIVLVTFNFQIIKMEEVKKLFKDGWNTKNDALKNTPSATSDILTRKGSQRLFVVLSNVDMDLDNIAYRTRSNFPINNDCVDIDVTKPSENISVKSKRKACRSTTSPSNVCPKRKVKRF
ncbi:hypothetical protein HanHA89_Chr09g0363661 [Helianthus annuus]|nr:hypothetical protein HanHA89_Chr09g0363661 [Helianthus annuus]